MSCDTGLMLSTNCLRVGADLDGTQLLSSQPMRSVLGMQQGRGAIGSRKKMKAGESLERWP